MSILYISEMNIKDRKEDLITILLMKRIILYILIIRAFKLTHYFHGSSFQRKPPLKSPGKLKGNQLRLKKFFQTVGAICPAIQKNVFTNLPFAFNQWDIFDIVAVYLAEDSKSGEYLSVSISFEVGKNFMSDYVCTIFLNNRSTHGLK